MATKTNPRNSEEKDLYNLVAEKLREKGIDLESCCCDETEGSNVKVVCLTPGLEGSFREMEKFPRGQTVMIRTDEETSRTLDAWVETGHFKSRSEAAALFLREGLKVRASELNTLTEALEQVKKAKAHLRQKASALFGEKKQSQ